MKKLGKNVWILWRKLKDAQILWYVHVGGCDVQDYSWLVACQLYLETTNTTFLYF